MVDDLGEGAEPDPGGDGAASLGEQRSHLSDRPGDGGAFDAEPAGQHVMSGPVAEVHERGQEPVDEDQPVLRTGTDGPLPRPGLRFHPVPFVP